MMNTKEQFARRAIDYKKAPPVPSNTARKKPQPAKTKTAGMFDPDEYRDDRACMGHRYKKCENPPAWVGEKYGNQ